MSHIAQRIALCYRRFYSDTDVTVKPYEFEKGTVPSGRITTFGVWHNDILVARYSAETRLIEADRKGQHPFKPHSKNFQIL